MVSTTTQLNSELPYEYASYYIIWIAGLANGQNQTTACMRTRRMFPISCSRAACFSWDLLAGRMNERFNIKLILLLLVYTYY